MHLPQELLDEIINNLPLGGGESLRNCSLVARSWTNPSQRRLFERVEILEGNSALWQINISPTNDELLQHVRSLSYVADTWDTIYHHDVLRDYLPSFRQLKYLRLSHINMTNLAEEVELYSAFQHTLSHLSINACDHTISSFIILINYFSSLDRLDVNCLFTRVDNEPIPPLSRPTIRELQIGVLYEHVELAVFFERLVEHGLAFDEVVVGHLLPPIPTLPRVFNALGANVKRLSILGGIEEYIVDFGTTLLSHFRELQELVIAVAYPGQQAIPVAILSSITSTNIRKITLVLRSLNRGDIWRRVGLQGYDDALCLLVDRPKCKNKLEVELRFVGDVSVTRVRTDLIPKFKEKGQVKIVWVDPDVRGYRIPPRG